MAKKIEQFKWYKTINGHLIAFFFAAPGQSLETAQYNAVGFEREIEESPQSEWRYVGITGYNTNPSLWREMGFPNEIPSKFFSFVIVDLFSKRLKKRLWQT